CQKYSVSPFTF
nr:immunoglobulin light chain junction region [Macaca mulatta]MOX09005.1 immunoglobulin light chain junction region [Macaca mulatta]